MNLTYLNLMDATKYFFYPDQNQSISVGKNSLEFENNIFLIVKKSKLPRNSNMQDPLRRSLVI